jgi:hypothetical protein
MICVAALVSQTLVLVMMYLFTILAIHLNAEFFGTMRKRLL